MANDCPICGCGINNVNLVLNELVPCPDCGTDLEVTNLTPFKLERAPEEKEDWGE